MPSGFTLELMFDPPSESATRATRRNAMRAIAAHMRVMRVGLSRALYALFRRNALRRVAPRCATVKHRARRESVLNA